MKVMRERSEDGVEAQRKERTVGVKASSADQEAMDAAKGRSPEGSTPTG